MSDPSSFLKQRVRVLLGCAIPPMQLTQSIRPLTGFVEQVTIQRDGVASLIEVTYNPQMALLAEAGVEILLLPIDVGGAYDFVGVAQDAAEELSEEWTWRKDWLTDLHEADVPLTDARFAAALRWQAVAAKRIGAPKRSLMDLLRDYTREEGA